MSELSKTKEKRLAKLLEVSHQILETGNARSFIMENTLFIDSVIPTDFITLFDELIQQGYSVDVLKPASNKILNIFHNAIVSYERIVPSPGSFLHVLEQNNQKMTEVLSSITPLFKTFSKGGDLSVTHGLVDLFEKLEVFTQHYVIKENILFPMIEKKWPDYRCLQIMWSFHDDIRRNIRSIIEALKNGVSDAKVFNKAVGDVFFNMKAIRFREEYILFPLILASIEESDIAMMNQEAYALGYPYYSPEQLEQVKEQEEFKNDLANLGTGALSIEQIKLIFNHLPVDITYVDENNKVRYFSTPPKRIFPRTSAIIGRDVSNCHPPESVHVVEQIVESFRKGEKSQADFWIKMKGEYILIQYFAVRNANDEYKGVIEVSQEVSGIKALEGEKRLLDW